MNAVIAIGNIYYGSILKACYTIGVVYSPPAICAMVPSVLSSTWVWGWGEGMGEADAYRHEADNTNSEHYEIAANALSGDHMLYRLRTNLDCNTAIYCCCTSDACRRSCVADVRPES